MLPEFKIYQPIQFGIFLTFATMKVVGESKPQNLFSPKKFLKCTSCLQPSKSLALGLSNRISNTMVKPMTKRILEYDEDYSDSNSSANKKARHSVIKEEEI